MYLRSPWIPSEWLRLVPLLTASIRMDSELNIEQFLPWQQGYLIFSVIAGMTHLLGGTLIVGGMVIIVFSQITIAAHAFSGNPIRGILCFIMPFYLLVYAKKHPVGRAVMRAWYAGVAALVVGVFLSAQ
jgi:hypothetical protein